MLVEEPIACNRRRRRWVTEQARKRTVKMSKIAKWCVFLAAELVIAAIFVFAMSSICDMVACGSSREEEKGREWKSYSAEQLRREYNHILDYYGLTETVFAIEDGLVRLHLSGPRVGEHYDILYNLHADPEENFSWPRSMAKGLAEKLINKRIEIAMKEREFGK